VQLNKSSYRAGVCLAAVLALLFLSMRPAAAADTPKTATHTLAIDGTTFQPAALTVKVGDSVIWVNKDPFPHTVTSTAGGFDSHEITPGKSWKYTAAKKGEFPYVCILHPTMKATLRVE
jgi:plastocyanin